METGKQMNVADSLARLEPETAWQPDVTAALVRLHQRRTKRKIRLASVLVVAGACVVAVMEFRGVSAADRILKDRQAAPDFALPDASGSVVRLSDFKHRVVLVNFWATWCGGCKVEIPWLIDFQNKYKDRGFTVIGVSTDDEGFKVVTPFFAARKMNYPVVIGDQKLAKLYGVESMPETLLIDGSGRIAAFHVGVVDKDMLEREIQKLLN